MRNRKGTYSLTTTPSTQEDKDILKDLAFERDYDNTPFYFTTNDRNEINNAMDILTEYNYSSPWTLVKK